MDENEFKSDPTTRAVYRPRSSLWGGTAALTLSSVLGIAMLVFGHITERLVGLAMSTGSVALITVTHRMWRDPIMWISDRGIAMPGCGAIAWTDIAGVVVYGEWGGTPMAFVVPKRAVFRSRSPMQECGRRMNGWVIGMDVWGGFAFHGMTKADRAFVGETLDSHSLPRLKARRKWVYRLMGFFGP